MLESLISSRIRRALVEYLLKYPENRFYLRGLAKELNLAISPLRRELKKLEKSGLLRTYQEGNILFYAVDRNHPLFLQLCQMLNKPETSAPEAESPKTPLGDGSDPATIRQNTFSSVEPKSEILIEKRASPSIRREVFFALSFVSVFLLLGFGVIYFSFLRQQPSLVKHETVSRSIKKANEVKGNSSGQMHSSNWRVMSGIAGGFGPDSGARQENY